ncbi:MAG TPA: hypothetical protein PKZ69_01970 [Candidatus Cloacimonadota bacterium]|nr:hypothetical protein [Candidatus Cloacimonadota bacterium]
MRKLLLIVLLFSFSIVLWANNSCIVKGLTVTDVPYDDGSGLLLKWEPLPKSCRIIEYRVYRGVSKDSLFYLGKIDVDPIVGVVGNEMQFSDNDFRPFVDLESPAKLKKEKGQSKDSPIYRSLPRNVSVVGPLLSKFSTLGIIDKDIFYYKTKKVIKNKELYAGLKTEEFEGIYANIIPGQAYYYTIIAVNEKGTYHPYAPIVKGISHPNLPEPVNSLYVKLIKDKSYLQYEFEMPLFTDGIGSFDFYILPKGKIAQFEKYKQFQKEYEEYIIKETKDPQNRPSPQPVENPAILINSVETSYPYPTPNFARIDLNDKTFVDKLKNNNIVLNESTLDNYYFIVSCRDYYGLEAFDISKNVNAIDSSALPIMPSMKVRDKPSDKGDMIELMIGRPIVYLTQINSDVKNKKKLTINYELLKNHIVKVKKVDFKFFDMSGKELGSVTEHYFDNIVRFTLPAEVGANNPFKVVFTIYTDQNNYKGETYLTQHVIYNEDLKQLKSDALILNNEHIMDYRYLILKKAKSVKNFQVTKRLSPLMNTFDDNIPYETSFFKGVADYDAKRGLFLFDSMIDLGYDENLQTTLITSLYLNDYTDNLKELLSDLTAKDDPNLQPEIDYYKSMLKMQEDVNILKEANGLLGKKRINFLKKYRENDKRTFIYYLVKTDGTAQFDLTENYIDDTHKNGEFFPEPDWFNMANLPMLIASLIFGILVLYYITIVKKGVNLYIRPIAGLEEIDNAIGRATEMGRPILFVPGLSGIDDVATLAALSILGHITKKAAEYDTKIIVPVCDYIVLPIAQQIVKEAHYEAGRPDSFDPGNVFFVADGQFAYVAGVNGVMIREKTATNFYLGMFYAEALLMTETGNSTGAIQISGSDALTQIPFFITTCDYTLIGEELYAASAYLAREALMLGTLKAQDYTKLLIIIFITVGTILSSFHFNFLINWFPAE